MRLLTALRLAAATWVSIAGFASADEVPRLTLARAAREALDANQDLAARRRALAAAREAVDVARSPLLPQVDGALQGQILESDRPDGRRGFVPTRSVTGAAGVSQVVYDEAAWAGFQVQQKVFDEQRKQLESFRLGVIANTARAYFELDRATNLVRIQERNRKLTSDNLKTTRARVAAGYSSERELLRWESQLAANEISVIQASVAMLESQFELNRVRNRPREEVVVPAPSSVEEHGFIYASDGVAKAIVDREGDRRLRDYLVRLGLDRSPVLQALDASIAAQERVLTESERAFWVPSLSVSAGVDHSLVSQGGSIPFDATEWGARALLSFPIFEGGAKIASLRQARETVSGLRLERRAQAITLDDGIRTAFAQASGAYRTFGFALEQERTARKNYEYVDDAYVLGVADYLQLLDAQNEHLAAQLTSVGALYDFLAALVEAERQIAFFPFLESDVEVAALIEGLRAALAERPHSAGEPAGAATEESSDGTGGSE